MSRILREYYEKKRLPLPEWLFDGDTPAMLRKQSVNRKPQKMADLALPNNQGPVRTPSRRRLWEQNPADPKNISSRERERQELRQAQPPPPPVPSNARNDRYSNEDRYGNRENDSDYSRETDRYNDRYRENQRDEDRYREHGYRDQKLNDYNAPPVDNYYQQPPPRIQTQNTNRPRYYDEDLSQPRSARGYQQRDPPPPIRANNYQQYDRGNELDDYYYSDNRSPPRREPSLRSGGRRYGNDPSYF